MANNIQVDAQSALSPTPKRGILVPLSYSLGSVGLAVIVAPLAVLGLWMGDARLGSAGYAIVGVALFLLILTPGTVAGVLATWLVDRRTPEGRRPFTIVMVILATLQLAGFAAIVFAVARAGANALIAVELIAPIVLLTVALCWSAEVFGRRDAARTASLQSSVIIGATAPLTSIRKVLVVMLATFVVAAALGVALLVAASMTITITDSTPAEDARDSAVALLFVFSFAFLAADGVAIGYVWRSSQRLKALFRGSYLAQKRLHRIVMKKGVEPLDDGERDSAIRYAQLQITNTSLALVQSLTIFAALATLQIAQLVGYESNRLRPFTIALLVLMAVGAVFVSWSTRRTVAKLRMYLATHLVPSGGAA